MVDRVAYAAASLALAALVGGCGVARYYEPRASWRADAENQCLASGALRASTYIQSGGRVGGRACGMDHPLKVSGLVDGRVAVTPMATINCPLTAALDRWIRRSVQPAAYRNLGEPVVGIRQIASYGCRGRNGSHRGPLSEHAFGNAIDIAAFRLASGREVSVVQGWWRGGPGSEPSCGKSSLALAPSSIRFSVQAATPTTPTTSTLTCFAAMRAAGGTIASHSRCSMAACRWPRFPAVSVRLWQRRHSLLPHDGTAAPENLGFQSRTVAAEAFASAA